MASRMREDPLIKIHSESSKEHHVGASTCLTTIFERVIKVVTDRLYTSYSLQPSGVHSASTEASLVQELRLSNCRDVKIIVVYVVHKTRHFIPY